MSDSILYLAIVAIVAVFLIPALIRRPHVARPEHDTEQDTGIADVQGAGGVQVTEDAVAAPAVADTPVMARPAYPAQAVTGSTADARDDIAADLDTHVYAEVRHGTSEYVDDVHAHHPAESRSQAETVSPLPSRPSLSRQQMMRARRRVLTLLAGLTLVTAFFVLTGAIRWWIGVPPTAMLVLYIALLREIAKADAELASKRRAWEARQTDAARAAHAAAWQRSHQVWQAEAPEPTAEVIDISGHVRDQLYDQYSDAAIRAVGD